MAYSSAADVRTQTPFKDTVNVETAYIAQKIAEADSLIDSVLAGVYVLPLSSTPEIIENLSKAIATCYLLREQNTNIEIEPGVSVEDFWKIQEEVLEAIRKRQIKLTDTSGVELPISDTIKPSYYPTDSSSDPGAENSTAAKFSMNQTF